MKPLYISYRGRSHKKTLLIYKVKLKNQIFTTSETWYNLGFRSINLPSYEGLILHEDCIIIGLFP